MDTAHSCISLDVLLGWVLSKSRCRYTLKYFQVVDKVSWVGYDAAMGRILRLQVVGMLYEFTVREWKFTLNLLHELEVRRIIRGFGVKVVPKRTTSCCLQRPKGRGRGSIALTLSRLLWCFAVTGVGTSTIGQYSFGWTESMSAAALAVGEALAHFFLVL